MHCFQCTECNALWDEKWKIFCRKSRRSANYIAMSSVCLSQKLIFIFKGKVDSRINQDDPGWLQDEPGWLQDNSNMIPGWPRITQDAFRMRPRMTSGWLQDDPGWLQELSKQPQVTQGLCHDGENNFHLAHLAPNCQEISLRLSRTLPVLHLLELDPWRIEEVPDRSQVTQDTWRDIVILEEHRNYQNDPSSTQFFI